jgi:hypothetical protein
MKPHLTPAELSQWIAGERPSHLEPHLRTCAECKQELERWDFAVASFGEAMSHWSAAAGSLPSAPRAPWYGWRVAWALAATAGAVLLAIPHPVTPPRSASGPFLEVPYVAPLAPYERAEVVRMQVPVAALIAAGLDVQIADAGTAVPADVVIGQDGRTLAIRLVAAGRSQYQ